MLDQSPHARRSRPDGDALGQPLWRALPQRVIGAEPNGRTDAGSGAATPSCRSLAEHDNGAGCVVNAVGRRRSQVHPGQFAATMAPHDQRVLRRGHAGEHTCRSALDHFRMYPHTGLLAQHLPQGLIQDRRGVVGVVLLGRGGENQDSYRDLPRRDGDDVMPGPGRLCERLSQGLLAVVRAVDTHDDPLTAALHGLSLGPPASLQRGIQLPELGISEMRPGRLSALTDRPQERVSVTPRPVPALAGGRR